MKVSKVKLHVDRQTESLVADLDCVCSECGNGVYQFDKFCRECGHKLRRLEITDVDDSFGQKTEYIQNLIKDAINKKGTAK